MIFKEDPNYLTLSQNLLSCMYFQFVVDSIGVFFREDWTGVKREMMDVFPIIYCLLRYLPDIRPQYTPERCKIARNDLFGIVAIDFLYDGRSTCFLLYSPVS